MNPLHLRYLVDELCRQHQLDRLNPHDLFPGRDAQLHCAMQLQTWNSDARICAHAHKHLCTQLDLASTCAGSTFEWQMLFRADTPLELLDYILHRWDQVSPFSFLHPCPRSAGIYPARARACDRRHMHTNIHTTTHTFKEFHNARWPLLARRVCSLIAASEWGLCEYELLEMLPDVPRLTLRHFLETTHLSWVCTLTPFACFSNFAHSIDPRVSEGATCASIEHTIVVNSTCFDSSGQPQRILHGGT